MAQTQLNVPSPKPIPIEVIIKHQPVEIVVQHPPIEIILKHLPITKAIGAGLVVSALNMLAVLYLIFFK